MSRAYRKWKERMKECRREGCVYHEKGVFFGTSDISMTAYRRFRGLRQRFLRHQKRYIRHLKTLLPNLIINTRKIRDPYQQVSEEERIRQANEYWRQNDTVH